MIRKKIENSLRYLLSFNESPERLALTFALGVFLTFTPLVGLHTLIGLAIAFMFGLNRVAMLFGLFINTPWTLVPYYTASAYLGGWLIGFPEGVSLPEFGWSQLLDGDYWLQLLHQWRLLLPMALGSTILAVLGAVLSYPLALVVLKRARISLKPDTRLESAF
jgi:uncharacterized protein (DUF2062 family)